MRKNPFGERTVFQIMLHQHQGEQPAKEVERVEGRGRAEKRVDILNEQLTPEQRAAGWSHFLQ